MIKRTSILVLFVFVSLYSCETKKEAVSTETQETTDTLQNEIKNSEIVQALESTQDGSYTVLQDDGKEKIVSLDPNETLIAANSLPVNAQKFVSQNFGNMEFIHAVKEVTQNITTYNIQLKDGTKIEFLENGNWSEVKNGLGKYIPTKFFPEKIQEYLKKNYANSDLKKIEQDIKDGSFEVELIQANKTLKFNLKGDFIKMD